MVTGDGGDGIQWTDPDLNLVSGMCGVSLLLSLLSGVVERRRVSLSVVQRRWANFGGSVLFGLWLQDKTHGAPTGLRLICGCAAAGRCAGESKHAHGEFVPGMCRFIISPVRD